MTMGNTIDGFRCELETLDDGRKDCFISKGRFSASLGAASDEGKLWASDWTQSLPIGQKTLAAIESWALANGY